MKGRVAPLLSAPLVLGALIVVGCKSSQEQVQPPAQKTGAGERIVLGEYGTLNRLRSADGKYLPAENGKTLGEGYAISYEYKESPKANPVKRVVYALADEHSDSLEVVPQERSAAGRNSVKAVVRTKDGALRISNTVTIDENTGLIEIWRSIQVVAEQGLDRLMLVKLQTGAQLSSGSLTVRSDNLSDFVNGIKSGGLVNPGSECGPCPPGCIAECEPPICVVNPILCNPNQYKAVQARAAIQAMSKALAVLKDSAAYESEQPQAVSGQPYVTTLFWELAGRPETSQIKQNQIFNVFVRCKNPFPRTP
jgi:hypothetical protein